MSEIKPDRKGLLDTEQAALLIGVSTRTILRWKRAGIMPPPVIGGPNKCWWARQALEERFLQTPTKSDKLRHDT